MSTLTPAIIEEQSSRFYSLYERKAKSFRSAMISVFALAGIVFILGFYPYVEFRGARYVLEAELVDLGKTIAGLEGTLKEYEGLVREYNDLRHASHSELRKFRFTAAQASAVELQQLFNALRNALGDQPELQAWFSGDNADTPLPNTLLRKFEGLETVQGNPCVWRHDDALLRCVLAAQLGKQHSAISRPFRKQRISHLRNDLYVPLYHSLSALHEDFNTWLAVDEKWWSFEGVTRKGGLSEQVRFYIDTYAGLIDAHARTFRRPRGQYEKQLYTLKKQRSLLTDELSQVKARLDEMKSLQEFDTPIGKLPVGLNDLVLLFPVLLAAGLLFMSSLFSETLKLRLAYHQLSRIRDPNAEIFSGSHLALVAPIWIDPLQDRVHRAYRALIFAVPALVFIATLLLLWRNHLLWGPFMQEARLGAAIYISLYVLSGLAILEGGRRVVIALRSYRLSLIDPA